MLNSAETHYLSSAIDCSGCNFQLVVSECASKLFCSNPLCKLHLVTYERPTIKLKKVK